MTPYRGGWSTTYLLLLYSFILFYLSLDIVGRALTSKPLIRHYPYRGPVK